MDVEQLIGTMIQGALAGGGKRSHRAGRYLRGGSSPFLNASTLLTVGGLIWGAIETMQQGSAQGARPAPQPGMAPMPPVASGAGIPAPAPPPLPGAPRSAEGQVPSAEWDASAAPIPDGAAKIIRLMVSAARADGDFTDAEREAVLQHARAAGAEGLVAEEIARPTPLARIVDGIDDEQQRADLYVLAYGIVRADEAVSGAEQIYLAQLAALLGLDPAKVQELERDAAAKIDGQ